MGVKKTHSVYFTQNEEADTAIVHKLHYFLKAHPHSANVYPPTFAADYRPDFITTQSYPALSSISILPASFAEFPVLTSGGLQPLRPIFSALLRLSGVFCASHAGSP